MSKAPTYDVNQVKLTEGTPEVLEVEAVDWRPAGDFPIENPFDVVMLELESQFRYNNDRAVGEIRNFTAIPCKSTSQRHSRLARLMAENPTILHMEIAVRMFLELYPKHQQKANWGLLRWQPGDMAKSENWSLKHVAYVTCEKENQQSWSEMQSVRVFERGSQEPIQRAPVEASPIRTERWPAKECVRRLRGHHLVCVRLLP